MSNRIYTEKMIVVQISSIQFGWLKRGAASSVGGAHDGNHLLRVQDTELQVHHVNENLDVPFNQHISKSAISKH